MKNLSIKDIALIVMGLAIAILYFLLFKSGSNPKVNLSPNSKEVAMAGGKIAFVNTDSFFSKYEVFKKLKKEVEATQKSQEATIQGKMKALEGDYMKLMQAAQSGQINPQQAQAQEKAMVARKATIEKEGQAMMKAMSDKSDKATKNLYTTLYEYFDENKEKYQCDYVMGYQTNGAMLYFDPSLDITNELVKDLNK